MGTPQLGRVAQFTLLSLRDHPDLRTVAAIKDGPMLVEGIEPEAIAEGLAELAGQNLAVQDRRGWRLTAFGYAFSENVYRPAATPAPETATGVADAES